MQIKALHKNIYTLSGYATKQQSRDKHKNRYQKPVLLWKKLAAQGVHEKIRQEATGISRATYYRYLNHLKRLDQGIFPPTRRPKKHNKPKWGEAEKQLILRLRRENPTYGKHKIAILLKRDHQCFLSQSTVGRILTFLKEKGLIQRSYSALKTKRKRQFSKSHAVPWCYKAYKDIKPGERVQIDHMTLSKNGVMIKHFQAWDRQSKYIKANIYSKATSLTAKKFLEDCIREFPFTITSVQVDGGSEFRGEFEKACKALEIELIVLPPRTLVYNGGVERGNRIFKEEFYYQPQLADSIGAFRAELKKAVEKYNTYRPHFNLKGMTPMQYIQNNLI